MDLKLIKAIEKINQLESSPLIIKKLQELLDTQYFQALFLLSIQNSLHQISRALITGSLENQFTFCVNFSDKNINTSLHLLASQGHIELMEKLYELPEKPEIIFNLDGLAPIHCAAIDNQLESLKFFHEKSPELLSLNSLDNHPPIFYALKAGAFESFLYLHTHPKNEISTLMQISVAAMSSCSKALNFLLKKATELHTPAFNNVPAVYQSALFGCEKNFFLLWDKTDLDIFFHSIKNIHQVTPLENKKLKEILAQKETEEKSDAHTPDFCVEENLQKNSFENQRSRLNEKQEHCSDILQCMNYAYHLLHWAVQGSCLNIVKTLLSKYPEFINTYDDMGQTPLHYSAQLKDSSITELLISQGANIVLKNYELKSPIELAALKGSVDNFNLLLRFSHKKIIEQYPNLLHLCALSGNMNLIQKSLDLGYSAYNLNDQDSFHPHHYCAVKGHKEAFNYLFSKSLELRDTIYKFDVSNDYFHAACLGDISILERIIKFKISEKMTAINGKSSPIHVAARYQHLECFKYLWHLTRHAFILDCHGVGVIHYACALNQCEMLKFILNNGGSVRQVDINLKTPLHYACQTGSLEAISLLLERGALLTDLDSQGRSAFEQSVIFNQYKSLLYLFPHIEQTKKKYYLLKSCLMAVNLGHASLMSLLIINVRSKKQRLSLAKYVARCIGASNQMMLLHTLLVLNFSSQDKFFLANEALNEAKKRNYSLIFYRSKLDELERKIQDENLNKNQEKLSLSENISNSEEKNVASSSLLFSSDQCRDKAQEQNICFYNDENKYQKEEESFDFFDFLNEQDDDLKIDDDFFQDFEMDESFNEKDDENFASDDVRRLNDNKVQIHRSQKRLKRN